MELEFKSFALIFFFNLTLIIKIGNYLIFWRFLAILSLSKHKITAWPWNFVYRHIRGTFMCMKITAPGSHILGLPKQWNRSKFRFWPFSQYNRFLPIGLKSNLWERQGTPYVYGSSGLSCSGGSTRNRIVGVRTHPHRVAYPTQTHHWASGWHPVTKAIQKTHIPWLNAISELPSHHNTCVVDCFRYVRQVCRHYWRVLLQSSSKW